MHAWRSALIIDGKTDAQETSEVRLSAMREVVSFEKDMLGDSERHKR